MARIVPGDLPVRFRYTPGVGGTAFFEALRDRGVLVGSRCSSCSFTYLPARLFCERCFAELAADTECGPEGTLESFTVAHVGIDEEPLAEPITWATVKVDGADTVMVHRLIDAVAPEVGMRVRAVVREQRTASIEDLEGFAPRIGLNVDFDLTPEQTEFRDVVRRFAEEVVAPRAAEADHVAELPMDVVKRMAELGLFGLPFPDALGGSDADTVTVCLAIEELGRVDQSIGITLSAAVGLGGGMVHRWGSPEQQQRWLGPIARGEILASFALTEPGGGTDASAARTTARLDGGEWVIDGTKAFITNCGTEISGLHVVVAATEPGGGTHGLSTFLVPAETHGITVTPSYRKMGWHASDTHELVFDGCRLPEDALLGERGRGYPQCLSILTDGRISVAALAVGCAQACLDLGVRYAAERETFGRSIGSYQAIQSKIADMQAATEAARLLTYRAAWLKDQGRPHTAESAMAKLVASTAAVDCAREAVQIHGGAGFIEESPVARFYRDAKVLEIGEGTSEIQRLILARELGLPNAIG